MGEGVGGDTAGRPGLVASPGDTECERLAIDIVWEFGLGRKHEPQGVDDVLARLRAPAPLGEDAGNLRDRRDDPAVLALVRRR